MSVSNMERLDRFRSHRMSSFERSAAVDTLLAMLSACSPGQRVTYEAMTRATNRNISGSDRHLLTTARKIMLRAGEAVFSPVHGVGIKRLVPGDFTLEGQRRIRGISRAAKRGGRIMDVASLPELSNDDQLRHAATRGVLAAIEASAKAAPVTPRLASNPNPVVKL